MRLKESRKLSKMKAHYVDAIVQREDRAIAIPEPYPNAHRLVEEILHGAEESSPVEPKPGEVASAA